MTWTKRFALIIASLLVIVTRAPAEISSQVFPQLDIQGYKKWEFKQSTVDPSKNYFSGLTQLGGYIQTYTGGPWQERLQLRIMGRLSEDLAVSYDLEQQPENPDKYNVNVKYDNNELTFGDLTANYTGNEFAATSRYLNGVMFSSKDSWYDILAVPSGKLKSQTQQLTSQKGNNTRGPYNLGHNSIVEGTERIELNNVLQVRNLDYTIDYFEGKITFNRIILQTDEIKYSYEYTNLIDLFFPSLSKRDFFGFQSRFTINPDEFGKPLPKPEPVVVTDRETFPTVGSEEAEVGEEESSGQYRLKGAPINRFSERLTFMGTLLKKDEDYLIRYDDGMVKLLTRFLPTPEEPLIVEYSHYQSSMETKVIAGIGSRGPYKLSSNKIIPGSDKIEVDTKTFVRDLDYTINYDRGEVIFGMIVGPTSQIKAQYRSNVLAIPPQITAKYPQELKVGTTILRETAKQGTTSPTSSVIESFTGQKVITNNYHLYLTNRPFTTTESGAILQVTVNGTTLVEGIDYAVPTTYLDPATGYYYPTPEATLAYVNDHNDPSDGFDTGTIKILDPALINATSEVAVSYTYYKNIVNKYNSAGDGTRGPYYLRSIRNVVPGSETVQVWDQGSSVITTFTRNASFDASAGDTGYSINYNRDNPSITFNNPLLPTKNFQIIFQNIPPATDQGGDLTQSVVGVDASLKIGDIIKIESSYAKSETDQLYIALATTESFSGNGGKTYALHSSQSIIESSEKVSVNNLLLNKDVDYFISYTAPGQITFYYITPATQDAISVDYQYQSTAGIPVGQTQKVGSAYKLGAETKLFGDKLFLSGVTKKADIDFAPLGNIPIGLGSGYKEYNLKFGPGWHSFTTAYSYKENNNPIGSYVDRFLNSYDNLVTFGLNPNSLAKMDLTYRNYQTLDDLLPGAVNYSSDNLQESYAFSLVPIDWQRGALIFSQKYDLSKTRTQNDVKRDSNNYSETTTNYWHLNGGLKFTERFTADLDYQYSEPQTIALKSSSTEATTEALSTLSRAVDTTYNFSLDLTFGPLQKWTTRFSLLNHDASTLTKNFLPTSESQNTKNETYHMDFIPFSPLTSSFDHNRQEKTSFTLGGANPLTERSTATVRLTPLAWLSGGWNGTNSQAIPETGSINRTAGQSNAYDLTIVPLSFDRFKLTGRFALSGNVQTAPTGVTGETQYNTDTNSFSQTYTAVITPLAILPLTVGWTSENYRNKNDHPLTASRIDTETLNDTLSLGATFTPVPEFSLISTYNQKITRVIHDLVLPPQDRQKTVLSGKINYRPVSWGTISFEREDEHNGGEIQAGAVAALNYEKSTQTISLNLNLPVDNPVLTSFVFIATIKGVNYKNLNNSNDDFNAARTTFEGSLNF